MKSWIRKSNKRHEVSLITNYKSYLEVFFSQTTKVGCQVTKQTSTFAVLQRFWFRFSWKKKTQLWFNLPLPRFFNYFNPAVPPVQENWNTVNGIREGSYSNNVFQRKKYAFFDHTKQVLLIGTLINRLIPSSGSRFYLSPWKEVFLPIYLSLNFLKMNVVISKGPLRNKDLRNKIF